MTDPGFKVEGVSRTDPFRPRVAFNGYQMFGDGDNAVFLERATAQRMRAAASKALPLETGGLLSGRTLRDGGGHYVLVTGFVEARPGSGRPVTFKISPQETERLREESSRTDPTADVVGWWHSHPYPSPYSPTDLASQSMWTQPHSVGLLVFADGKDWGRAYMGPGATSLGYPTVARSPGTVGPSGAAVPPGTVGPSGAAGRDEGPRSDANAQPDPPPLIIPNPPKQRVWQPTLRQWGLVRLAAIIVFGLLLILIIFLLATVHGLSSQLSSGQRMLSSQFDSEQRRLAAQISSTQRQLARQIELVRVPPPARPSVSWSCVSAPSPPGSYSCRATTSGSPGKVLWELDGKLIESGLSVTIEVPQDHHAHRIQALLKTSAGLYPGNAQIISAR